MLLQVFHVELVHIIRNAVFRAVKRLCLNRGKRDRAEHNERKHDSDRYPVYSFQVFLIKKAHSKAAPRPQVASAILSCLCVYKICGAIRKAVSPHRTFCPPHQTMSFFFASSAFFNSSSLASYPGFPSRA